MNGLLECPRCRKHVIDLHDYQSMVVVTAHHALFGLKCPDCGLGVSSVQAIPADMQDEVLYAAVEVGAGMGHVR